MAANGLVGFTGSRSLAPQWAGPVAQVVAAVQAAGHGVAVGCAGGADLFVRQACPSARVFSVVSGQWGKSRGAFAARSQSMVRSVVGSGSGAALVGFVSAPCPAGVFPARQFSGKGSGSWGTLAYAAGQGLPVTVFWCASGSAQLPAWGAWLPVQLGGVSGWQLAPAQSGLF